jgi:hypothetical protein
MINQITTTREAWVLKYWTRESMLSRSVWLVAVVMAGVVAVVVHPPVIAGRLPLVVRASVAAGICS